LTLVVPALIVLTMAAAPVVKLGLAASTSVTPLTVVSKVERAELIEPKASLNAWRSLLAKFEGAAMAVPAKRSDVMVETRMAVIL